MTDLPTTRTSIDDLLSGPDTTQSAVPGPGDGPGGLDPDFEIMPRPRRRPTRLTAALALLAAAAAGFAGGLHAPGRSANPGATSQAGPSALGSGPASTGNMSPAGAGLPGGNQPTVGGRI